MPDAQLIVNILRLPCEQNTQTIRLVLNVLKRKLIGCEAQTREIVSVNYQSYSEHDDTYRHTNKWKTILLQKKSDRIQSNTIFIQF